MEVIHLMRPHLNKLYQILLQFHFDMIFNCRLKLSHLMERFSSTTLFVTLNSNHYYCFQLLSIHSINLKMTIMTLILMILSGPI